MVHKALKIETDIWLVSCCRKAFLLWVVNGGSKKRIELEEKLYQL